MPLLSHKLSIRILDFIVKLLFDDELVEALINNHVRFIFKPSRAMQPLMLVLTGSYGFGSELVAQRIFYMLANYSNVIADVGAHYGFYTLLAASSNAKMVLSFEPSRENYEILKLNVNMNSLSNVKTYMLALADYNGQANLGIPRGGKSGENTMAVNEDALLVEKVHVRRFDSLAYEEGIKSVDLVKIDVEGAELKVLKGFGDYLKIVQYILVEVHPKQIEVLGDSTIKLYEYLNSLGYEIYCIYSKEPYIYSSYTSSAKSICSMERHHILAVNTKYYKDTRKIANWIKNGIKEHLIEVKILSRKANALMNTYKLITKFKELLSLIIGCFTLIFIGE